MTIIETYFDDEDECLGCWVLRKTPHKGEVNWPEVEPHTKHSLQLLNCTNHTNYKWRLALCSILCQLNHLSAVTHTVDFSALLCIWSETKEQCCITFCTSCISVSSHKTLCRVYCSELFNSAYLCQRIRCMCSVFQHLALTNCRTLSMHYITCDLQ